jgi:hypothetical protein
MLKGWGIVVGVIMMMFLGLGAPNLYAQYDTYYSPEKRLVLDYPTPSNEFKLFNITETTNQTYINSDLVIIRVTISPEQGLIDLDERAVYSQKNLQDKGYGLVQTTQPILIDDLIGYFFIVSPPDSYMLINFIYVIHDDKLYKFQLSYGMEFAIDDYEILNHIIHSIKFFD